MPRNGESLILVFPCLYMSSFIYLLPSQRSYCSQAFKPFETTAADTSMLNAIIANMDAKSGPEYIIRRKVGKRCQPTPTNSASAPTPTVPRPIYSPVPASSSPSDFSDFLALVSAREWVGSTGDFRLASYDILSDSKTNSQPELFSHCPPSLLVSEARISRVIAELYMLKAHLICLQGVEQYQSDLLTAFPHYETFYTAASPHTGVAILYDTRVFEMTKSAKVVLAAEGHSVLSRPNMGLIAVLRHRKLHREVLVATVQLSHCEGLTQLGQLLVLTKAVAEVVRTNRGVSVLIAGSFDFNPGSTLYRFLSEGKVATTSLDLSQLANWYECDTATRGIGDSLVSIFQQPPQSSTPPIVPQSTHISHLCKTGVELLREGGTRLAPARLPYIPEATELTTGLPPLHSAYQTCTGAEAFPTVYSGSVLGGCDYIWQGQEAEVTGVLKVPAMHSVLRFPSAPNQVFPSDHISVAADFQFRPQT